MSYVREALNPYSATRAQERSRNGEYIQHSVLIARPNQGYCECCRMHKPAPKIRKKGWRCADCRRPASTR